MIIAHAKKILKQRAAVIPEMTQAGIQEAVPAEIQAMIQVVIQAAIREEIREEIQVVQVAPVDYQEVIPEMIAILISKIAHVTLTLKIVIRIHSLLADVAAEVMKQLNPVKIVDEDMKVTDVAEVV